VIARASATAEETLVAECDLAKIEQVRRPGPSSATAASTPTPT